MTESPDIPWARYEDSHGAPPEPKSKGTAAGAKLQAFIKAKGVSGGSLLVIGAQGAGDAIAMALLGFDVHLMDISMSAMEGIDRYGVKPHCGSPSEFWLFENKHFDSILDTHHYASEPDPGRRAFYRGELLRVLKSGCPIAVSVPRSMEKRTKGELSDSGFVIAPPDGADEVEKMATLILAIRK